MAEQQKRAPLFKVEFLTEIDLDNFQIDGNKLLIQHDAVKSTAPVITNGGVVMSEEASDEIRNAVLTSGTIVSLGTGVLNPDYKVGTTVYFYKAQSNGAFRTGKIPYYVYEEYNIYGHLKTNPVPTTGLIGQA